MDNINDLFIKEIKKNVPKGEKPVVWLMREFKMEKATAYRRMQGRVPFLLNEVATIAHAMNISLDNMVNKLYVGDAIGAKTSVTADFVLTSLLSEYLQYLRHVSSHHSVCNMVTCNRINLFDAMEYDALFSLFVLKLQHRLYHSSNVKPLAQLEIPEKAIKLRQEILKLQLHNTRNEYIIGRDLFESIADNIRFLSRSKLISDEEVEILKTDLLIMLKQMERRMTDGIDADQNEYTYYYSLVNVESNSACLKSDKSQYLMQYNPQYSLLTLRQGNSLAYEEWFKSQKKYTVVISQSNEFIRSEFIEKQREIIHNLQS